ncbi:hypothetical protein MKY96_33085 [Paenibacillus sp. FSL R7-0302]|uniref:hypothetical protein n=1 Tax=Paenibacillus sp. FSL R7-0302 TaxID=2921681 RepID=UPI0030F655D2
MNTYLQYNDPIRIQFRSGTASDPYVSLNESQKIINNVITLQEIPDEFTHVNIAGYTEGYNDVPTSAGEFVVNYTNGLITFHPTQEGKTVTASYKGRGFIKYPAERIYAHGSNPDVTITLQDMIDQGIEGLKGLEQLTTALAGVGAATTNAATQAGYAKTQGDYAKTQGDYAKVQGDYGKAQGDAAKSVADALVYKGVYSSGSAYISRNIVYYNGSTYICVAASTGNLPTNTTYWRRISGTTWRAVYSPSSTYNYGDFVSDASGNTLYMSIIDSNLNKALTDATSWNKMISVQTAIDNAVTATTNANAATTAANTAKTNADTATTNANNATTAANTAKTSADTATTNANAATTKANTAATNADAKATYADQQGDYAKSVGDSLVHKGTYAAATAYIPRNIVYYNGSTYMNVVASTGVLPTDTTKWQKITNMAWKGTYSASITYNYGETVVDSVNQNVYMCILDGTLNKALTTTTNWTLLMSVAAAINSANTATTAANTAKDAANTAKTNADTATGAANTAATHANTQGDYAKVQGDYAKEQGALATAKKDDLDSSVTRANTAKTQLDASIATSDLKKTALDTSISTAGTKQTTLDATNSAADTLNTSLGGKITTGSTLKTDLDNRITTGSTLRNDLDSRITSGNTTKTNLDGSIATAGTSKSSLDGSISTAGTKKNDLDGSITTANSTKVILDSSISSGNALKTELDATVSTGSILRTNLVDLSANGEVLKSGLLEAISNADVARTLIDGSVVNGQNKIQQMNDKIVEANLKIQDTESARVNVISTDARLQVFEEYSATKTYFPLNKVSFNGSSYVCIRECKGISPTYTNSWLIIAQRGADGTGTGTLKEEHFSMTVDEPATAEPFFWFKELSSEEIQNFGLIIANASMTEGKSDLYLDEE